MTRYAWVLEVSQGIFRHGLTLFGYFETDDLEKTQEYLASDETNQ